MKFLRRLWCRHPYDKTETVELVGVYFHMRCTLCGATWTVPDNS